MLFENGCVPREQAAAANRALQDELFQARPLSEIHSGKTQIQQAGLEGLFGDPVIDYRMAAQLPDLFSPHDKNLDSCDAHPATKNQKDSLESTAKGNSLLHRMYEVAVLSPQGQVAPHDFAATYGKAAAEKMNELGISGVSRLKSSFSVTLQNPLHYGDASGSIEVGTRVTFNSHPGGGALTLDQISGVTAKSGIFALPINRIDLQPRQEGYLSGNVIADWSQTKICATPDGTIYH